MPSDRRPSKAPSADGARPCEALRIESSATFAAPWIVLVHGVSQDHRLFESQIAAFQASYRLLVVDLPGHGLSTALPGPYGIAEFAKGISRTLDIAEIKACHFWGTHLGAGAGLYLACTRPDLFQSMILEAPVFPGRALPSVGSLLERVRERAQTNGIGAARELWWTDGPWFDVIRENPTKCRAIEHRRMIEDFAGGPWLDFGLVGKPLEPVEDPLRALEVPTLLINGEHDDADFLDASDALAQVVPQTQLAVVPNAGGFPLWEFPDAVNTLVAAFLEGLEGGS